MCSVFRLYGFKISPMAYQLQYYQSQTVAQASAQPQAPALAAANNRNEEQGSSRPATAASPF